MRRNRGGALRQHYVAVALLECGYSDRPWHLMWLAKPRWGATERQKPPMARRLCGRMVSSAAGRRKSSGDGLGRLRHDRCLKLHARLQPEGFGKRRTRKLPARFSANLEDFHHTALATGSTTLAPSRPCERFSGHRNRASQRRCPIAGYRRRSLPSTQGRSLLQPPFPLPHRDIGHRPPEWVSSRSRFPETI